MVESSEIDKVKISKKFVKCKPVHWSHRIVHKAKSDIEGRHVVLSNLDGQLENLRFSYLFQLNRPIDGGYKSLEILLDPIIIYDICIWNHRVFLTLKGYIRQRNFGIFASGGSLY